MATWVTDKYPGGSTQIWGAGLAFKQAPCKLVMHSTETTGYPNYRHDGKKREPHVTAHFRQRTWRQHIPLNQAAYALAAPVISTNTMGAIQVEIIGYAASLKDISQADLDWLAGLLRMLAQEAGVPLVSSVQFAGGEAYGINGAVRISATEWNNYRGFLGHQHVPTNSHWDPGALDIDHWMNTIRGDVPTPAPDPTPTPNEEDTDVTVILTSTGDYGLANNGWHYLITPDGTLRAVDSREYGALMLAGAKEFAWGAADIYDLMLRNGVYEYTGNPGSETGADPLGLTGRILGRNATADAKGGVLVAHFPVVNADYIPDTVVVDVDYSRIARETADAVVDEQHDRLEN